MLPLSLKMLTTRVFSFTFPRFSATDILYSHFLIMCSHFRRSSQNDIDTVMIAVVMCMGGRLGILFVPLGLVQVCVVEET